MLKTAISWVGWGLIAVAVAAVLAHALAGWVWSADVAELFRPWLAALSLAPLALFAAIRAPFASCVAGLAALINVAMLVSPAIALGLPGTNEGGRPLVLVSYNCLSSNTQQARFAAWVRRIRPDVIALQEAPFAWRETISGLKDVLPYTSSSEVEGWRSTRLLSRSPITNASRFVPTDDGRAVEHASINLGYRPVEVFAIHPNTLQDPAEWKNRNAYLGLAAQWISGIAADKPALVLGDFNTSPWSPYFAGFLRATRLKAIDLTMVPHPTRILWEFAGVLFGSPIDHIAASNQFRKLDCEVGPDLGSDHRPLVCRVDLQRR